MSKQHKILSDFQAYAEGLVKTHNLPAISLAVWHNKKLYQAAAGVLSLETGVEATIDSIFQIGSITKVMTASLVMQLVDEGRVKLDNPVKQYIRDFAIDDHDAAESITVRQLINHTSGISSDFFPNDCHQTGNPIARFVDRCNLLPLVHPVGECYSYSNAAFAMAGRLVEVVTGGTWFDAMEERLFQPLGLEHAICRPMDVLRYRAAIGHTPNPDSSNSASQKHWQQAKQLYLTMAHAPAGSTPMMTAADLITFAQAHLSGGLTKYGQRWLSENAISQMQQPQIEQPALSSVITSHMGLGWGLHRLNYNGRLIFGHGGGTLGQMSMLRVVPDSDVCIALLINCDNAEVAYQTVVNELLNVLADIDLTEPAPSVIDIPYQQLIRYTGDYKSLGEHYSIVIEDRKLVAKHKDFVFDRPATKLHLKALDDSVWVGYNEQGYAATKIRFLNPDARGKYAYLFNGQMNQRVE